MYQVWTKDEYQEGWTRNDCKDLEEARETIIQAARTGREPLLTQEVPFTIEVKVKPVKEPEPELPRKEPEPAKEELKEEPKIETEESKPEGDKGSEGKSHRPVR